MKYFKNLTETSADLYIYGSIVDDSRQFWDDEKDKFSVDPLDFKEELEGIGNRNINIYINSGGGSVFAASSMVSMLKRFKEQKQSKIYACVDGLCASAATYLLMAADKMRIYDNSIVMIHKPMTISYGNADDLAKDIQTLDTIENDMMIPMYLSKAKVSEDEIRELVRAETWFSGNKESEMYIGSYFDVEHIEESKQIAAYSGKLLNRYRNTPEELKKAPESATVATDATTEKEPDKPQADIYKYKIKILKLEVKKNEH